MLKVNCAFLYLFSVLFSQAQFYDKNYLNLGTSHRSHLIAEDFDGDTDKDLMILGSGTVLNVIWFENQAGNFETFHIIDEDAPGANDGYFIDIDNDGLKDFVISSSSDNEISWYKNFGSGNFSEENIISTTVMSVSSLRPVDIDNDGDVDILGASESNDAIYWFENLGSGNFGPQQIVTAATNGPKAVFSADLDNDLDEDIISASFNDDKIAWYQNLGGGVFGPQIVLTISADGAMDVNASDFDNDGDLDICAVTFLQNDVIYFENLGSGVFGTIQTLNYNDNAVSQVLGFDVNNDGLKDIVTSSNLDDNFKYYPNLGGGLFGAEISLGTVTGRSFTFADFDNDSDNDIFVTNISNTYLIESFGGGSYGSLNEIILMHTDFVTGMSLIDLDNDGNKDVLVSSKYDNRISWFKNLNNGSYSLQQIITESVIQPVGVDYADVDDDGFVDIISASAFNSDIVWIKNNGAGSFSSPAIISTLLSTPTTVSTSDVDSDGDKDVVVTYDGDNYVIAYKDVGSSFGSGIYVDNDCDGCIDANLVDVDNDGDIDAVTVGTTEPLSVLKNNGIEIFGTPVVIDFLVSTNCEMIETVDFDNDNDADIVLAMGASEQILLYKNDGTGNFGSSIVLLSGVGNVTFVTFFDMENDGDLDVFFATDQGTFFSLNDGLGNLDIPVDISGPQFSSTKMIVTDLDIDYDADVFSGGYLVFSQLNPLYEKYQINGHLFIDQNQNDTFNIDEYAITQIPVLSNPAAPYTFTNSLGQYFINFADTGNYTIAPDVIPYWSITTDYMSYNIDVDTGAVLDIDYLFGFYPDTVIDYLEVDLTAGFPICNQIIHYWITIENAGTTFPDGVVELCLDSSLNFISASVVPDSVNYPFVYWSYDSLDVFSSLLIDVLIEMPDVFSMGDTLTSTLLTFVDSIPLSPFYADTINQILLCAYDPNDKIVNPVGIDSAGFIPISQDFLEYTIRFQNTGTFTATDVSVHDVLDSSLNWNSVELIASSHPVELLTLMSGKIIFNFENIFLPDSASDFLGSQGFVKFRVEIDSTVLAGEKIINKAFIYFDENPAIITNNTINTIYDCQYLISLSSLQDNIICENEDINASIDLSTESIQINWNYLGDDYSGSEFNHIADTSGILTVNLNVETDFCSVDTNLNVSVLPISYVILDSIFICQGNSAIIFGVEQYFAGQYTDTLINSVGCDSILIIDLLLFPDQVVTIEPLNPSQICTDAAPIELEAIPSGGTFTGAGVSGNLFNPSLVTEGDYYLYYEYLDSNSCLEVDSIFISLVDCLGLNDLNIEIMEVVPNPFSDFTLITFNEFLSSNHTLIIVDINGKVVYRNDEVNGNNFYFYRNNLNSGVYKISLIDEQNNFTLSERIIVLQ